MTMLYERITITVICVYIQKQTDLYIKLCHAGMQDLAKRLTDNISF